MILNYGNSRFHYDYNNKLQWLRKNLLLMIKFNMQSIDLNSQYNSNT